MPTVAGCSTTGNNTTTGSLTADLPVAAQTAGRLLLGITFVRFAPADVNLPSNSPGAWSLLSGDDDTTTNITAEVASKISVGASETAPTMSSSIVGTFGTMGIIAAIDSPGTVLISPAAVGSNANIQAPSVLAAQDQALILRVFINGDNNTIITPPSGTQVFSQIIGTQGRFAMHVYSQVQSGAGATGTATLVASGSDPWLAYTIVIQPSASGTTYQESSTQQGAGTLNVAAPKLIAEEDAALHAAGTLNANAKIIAMVAQAMHAAGTMNVSPQVIRPAQANLQAAGVLAANPKVVAAQAVSMTAAGQFMAQARVVHQLQLSMRAAGTFNAILPTPGGSGMFTPGPCSPWEPVWGQCVLPTGSEAISGNALMAASEILWSLTGQRFGTCTVTLRPCRESCYGGSWLEEHGWWQFGSYPTPAWFQGAWFNIGCGGCGNSCSCNEISELRLPGPVASIDEVKIDDVVLDPSAYMVQNWNLLVRADGGQWPLCNDFSKLSGDGVWTVTASFGEGVPVTGKLAVAELAVEIANLLLCNDECRLPVGVQQVTRQGVSMTFNEISEVYKEGLVGLPLSDRFIQIWNPHRLQSPSAVYDIDGGSQDWRRDT